MQQDELEYAGFWIRTWASVIDTILLMLVIVPLLISIYGYSYFDVEQNNFISGPMDFLITWILPATAIIVFWMAKQATPGKMAISAKIVDATTGNAPSAAQLVGRYFAYFIASLPLGLGILWVAFDKKKQGWHDKLAGTVVVRRIRGPGQVKFEQI